MPEKQDYKWASYEHLDFVISKVMVIRAKNKVFYCDLGGRIKSSAPFT